MLLNMTKDYLCGSLSSVCGLSNLCLVLHNWEWRLQCARVLSFKRETSVCLMNAFNVRLKQCLNSLPGTRVGHLIWQGWDEQKGKSHGSLEEAGKSHKASCLKRLDRVALHNWTARAHIVNRLWKETQLPSVFYWQWENVHCKHDLMAKNQSDLLRVRQKK